MSYEKTGGPAFPVKMGCVEDGMTLRDYFAAKAMLGFITVEVQQERIAKWAYEIADAMLEARGQDE